MKFSYRELRKLLMQLSSWLLLLVYTTEDFAQEASYNFKAGEIRVFEVVHEGTDFAVVVKAGAESFEVNHPLHNTGPELFVVGPYASARNITLAARVIDGATPKALKVISKTIALQDPALTAYRTLTEAGTLFALQTRAAAIKALQLYQSIDAQTLPLDWRYYPSYLAAETQYFLFDLVGVRQQLEAFPPDTCAVPNFCYKDDLLSAEVGFVQDEYEASILRFQKVVDTINRSDKKIAAEADLSKALMDLSISQVISGRRDVAFVNANNAMALAEKLQSSKLIGEGDNTLATFYAQGEEPRIEQVAELLQKSANRLKKSTDIRSYVAVVSNLSSTYNYLGEFRKAQYLALSSLERAEQASDASSLMGLYHNLIITSLKLGDWDPAEHYARSVIAYEKSSGREARLNTGRNNLGTALRAKGKVLEAEQEHLAAFNYFKSVGSVPAIAGTLKELAKDAMAREDYKQAEIYIKQVVDSNVVGSMSFSKEELIEAQANLALAQGKPKVALALLQPEWQRMQDREARLDQKIQLAGLLLQTHIAINDFDTAQTFGDALLALSNDMRGQLEHVRLGAAWSASIHHYFKLYAEMLIHRYERTQQQSYLEQALEVLESARGSNLLLARSAAEARQSIESEAKEELRHRLTEVSNRRAAQLVGTTAYEKLSQEYFQLLEKFQADYVQTNQSQAHKFSLQALQAKLGSDKALVEFLCQPNAECHAIVAAKELLTVWELGDFADIQKLTHDVAIAMRTPGADTHTLRHKLGALLFGKLKQNPVVAAKKQLLLVVDFPLNNLPFSALLIDDTTTLAQQYQLASISSLNAYNPQNSDARKHSVEVAVFADPVFSRQAVHDNAGNSENFTGWLESLDRLRWSAVEAKNLQTLFSDSGMKIYTRETATRANLLKEETRNARVIHIASHAYYNESMQDLVGIAFSAPSEKGGGDFLTLEELFEYPFTADLVVISGCDTGVGAYQPGEGNQSLAHGFLGQGVNHVISTLWPVSDRASVEFMRVFYAALKENKNEVALALQKAQVALANNPEFADPAYWAPYSLSSAK